jgi:hypothetical protein
VSTVELWLKLTIPLIVGIQGMDRSWNPIFSTILPNKLSQVKLHVATSPPKFWRETSLAKPSIIFFLLVITT